MTTTRKNNYIYLKRFAAQLDPATGTLDPTEGITLHNDDGTTLLIKPYGMIAELTDKDGNWLATLHISSNRSTAWYKETGMEEFVICNPEILELAYECDRERRANG